MTERGHRLLGGIISIIAGAFTAAMIYWHPEKLHAPAWVAYTACAAFVFAGLTIAAHEFGLRRIHSWLVVACVAALLIPGAWVAFGAGPRECAVSLPFFSTAATGAVCRTAFGFGVVLVAALLVLAVVRARRSRNAS